MYAIDGEALRRLRRAALLSQRELAEKAGIMQSTVSRLEVGKQSAYAPTVRALSKALGVDASAFLEKEHGDQRER